MRAGLAAAAAAAAVLVAAGCSASSSSSSSVLTPASPSGSATAATSVPTVTPSFSAGELNRSFSAMAKLKPVAAEGKGAITVLLPDATDADLDQPYLDRAFADAGLPAADYTVDNALGSETKQLSMAESAVNAGASVLVLDPVDSAVGVRIESYAKSKGVAVIDYDQLTAGGSAPYYVGFNAVTAGTLTGQGLASCVAAWGVRSPTVIVMNGAAAGGSATRFAQGYDAVLAPYFSSGKWTDVAAPAATSAPSAALSEFEQQYAAHAVNAALIPDDESGAQVIAYLRSQGVKPKTVPVAGQDATLAGLQDILAGYECGTVYEPAYLEAQAAAALALYLRADKNPPSALVNGQTEDTATKAEVPSVLLTPAWVTAATMNTTVIADKFVTAGQLCAGSYASACAAAGISG